MGLEGEGGEEWRMVARDGRNRNWCMAMGKAGVGIWVRGNRIMGKNGVDGGMSGGGGEVGDSIRL